MVTGATCVGKVGRRGLHLAASAFLPRPISMRTFVGESRSPVRRRPFGRHAADLADLTTEEAAAFMADVTRVAKAVRAHFGGTLVNVQVLGNTEPHLHAHVSARYLAGDVAPGLPLPMGPLGELSEAELQLDADALSRLLERDRVRRIPLIPRPAFGDANNPR